METAVVNQCRGTLRKEISEKVLEIRVKRTPFGLSLNGVFFGLRKKEVREEIEGKGKGKGLDKLWVWRRNQSGSEKGREQTLA